ncbi:Glyoxalase/Bleomycin resistance protein/Dioxygenase superfamily protein [Brevibacterium siliguriense]|uniref:Glyoxalase/Bleomycin resistance protein/Dioxygenase superfamily protein n=1 Tax=Brevibacterium siliguriense TaxID=1136497 RepID=A0A1H1SCM0_9MICO|nr:glyoxalase [Brevibacterium siliguriense]SDS45099.1 Glyoxalase/Bleomycin resistance protein/Dioxygenase superfamily protein [Brevibacterium siliguriense]
MSGIHHVEVWLAESTNDFREWRWLLERVGFTLTAEWENGQSWEGDGAYLSLTTSPNTTAETHDRRRPGINHLAFKAGSPAEVDSIMDDAESQGWSPLYHDRYPHAGGPGHYAGWLVNTSGFKTEVVADY